MEIPIPLKISAPSPRHASVSRLTTLAAVAFVALASVAHAQTSSSFRVAHAFNGVASDGKSPLSTLLRGQDGNLYGTTQGGSSSQGTVFKFTPSGVLTTFYDFGLIGSGGTDSDGAAPNAGLVQGTDGNFYGTTQRSGPNNTGTVFKLTPAGVLTTLHPFAPGSSSGFNDDGLDSQSPLVRGTDGNFYGTAEEGGANGNGTIFKITPDGVFSLLHTFSDTPSEANYQNADGANPTAGLVQGRDGDFYGAAAEGGMFRYGTIFKVTSDGVFTTLYNFVGPEGSLNDGESPSGTLVQGRDGSFYGTARGGGILSSGTPQTGGGTVFKITPDGVFTLLHRFDSFDNQRHNREGVDPIGGLIQGSDGNFYGVCEFGGANGNGTVFQITPAGAFHLLHTFGTLVGGDNKDGARPNAGLTQGAAGHYYGMALLGGTADDGTIYEITFAPVISSATTATGAVGKEFSYQITANHSPASYAATGLPGGLNIDAQTGLISGTPATAGTVKITLKAINAYGTGTATLTLTIQGAPVVTSATVATAQVGEAFSYQIKATNSPTTYGVGGLRPGLSVDVKTGLITGTPTGAGTFTLVLRASNANGTASQNLTLTIKPSTPVITSPGTAPAQVGQPFSYQIKATSSPTNYGVGGLRAGLTVNQMTGLISGTPTGSGTITLDLRAANSGGTGTKSLTLTIAPR